MSLETEVFRFAHPSTLRCMSCAAVNYMETWYSFTLNFSNYLKDTVQFHFFGLSLKILWIRVSLHLQYTILDLSFGFGN